MKTKFLLFLLSGLFFMSLFQSCVTRQVTTKQGNTISIKPRLLFLTYSIYKSSNGNFRANLINKIIVEGTLKRVNNEHNTRSPSTIQCIQTNKNSMPIQTINMNNPLIKIVEYSDETGQLNKKQIELDSTQISIRMQLHSQSKFVILKHHRSTDGSTVILTKNEL